MRLNLGCGHRPIDGYDNVDLYVSGHIPWDIRNLPVEDSSVDEINAEHVLEHFGKEEGIALLKHWYAKIKKGGIISLEVPDFEYSVKDWLEAPDNEHRYGHRIERIFGLQCHDGEYHKTGFTVNRMKYVLELVGFSIITCESVWSDLHDALVIKAVARK